MRTQQPKDQITQWWASRRLKCNKGLVIAGVSAFFLYAFLGELFIAPYQDFEINIPTTLIQGIGYILTIGIANIFYSLGAFVDRKYNRAGNEKIRIQLSNFGYWFSFSLPFLIAVIASVT